MFTFAVIRCSLIKRFVQTAMASPPSKKVVPMKKIGTHSGKFHCDDVFAVFLLKQLPQYKHAEIIRTRKPDILKTCDIVVDVGGEYNPSTHRYDHHQRTFSETMNSITKTKPWTIKLSSAGLVYCHFGMDILKTMVPENSDEKFLSTLFNQLYSKFVMEIDAIDNGIPMFDGEPKYDIHTSISARVSHVNPPWNAPEEDEESVTHFSKAMDLIGEEFKDRVDYYTNSWWPARSIVLETIENRFKVHKSGEIMEFETCCPWKEHFFDLLEELNIERGVIKFVIYLTPSGVWYVNAVPISSTSFICHRFLLEPWRGIREEELSKITGIENCVFVHANGFIGGNMTREGAIQMAVKSIEAGKQPDDGKL